mgnify:CR=1 FL=1
MLGGNGAIESFSVLPRLLRDNVVFENWEGTHNVLLVQVQLLVGIGAPAFLQRLAQWTEQLDQCRRFKVHVIRHGESVAFRQFHIFGITAILPRPDERLAVAGRITSRLALLARKAWYQRNHRRALANQDRDSALAVRFGHPPF